MYEGWSSCNLNNRWMYNGDGGGWVSVCALTTHLEWNFNFSSVTWAGNNYGTHSANLQRGWQDENEFEGSLGHYPATSVTYRAEDWFDEVSSGLYIELQNFIIGFADGTKSCGATWGVPHGPLRWITIRISFGGANCADSSRSAPRVSV